MTALMSRSKLIRGMFAHTVHSGEACVTLQKWLQHCCRIGCSSVVAQYVFLTSMCNAADVCTTLFMHYSKGMTASVAAL